ncbi:MAG: KamA family radical SAM protein [Akkermansiaceae bacterium]
MSSLLQNDGSKCGAGQSQLTPPPPSLVEADRFDLPDVDYNFRGDQFWRQIPGWKDVSSAEFGDYSWQQRNSVTSLSRMAKVLGDLLPDSLAKDIEAGLERTPMNVRMTPYIFSLIDWSNAIDDPTRAQFLPLGSQFLDDHPCYMDDSLNEDGDKATPYLTHRYPDKVLFLPITLCPVYCSYCTRSRVVGGSTKVKNKSTYGASKGEWESTYQYIRDNSQIEDVVISGGDAFLLRPEQIQEIGMTLLDIPHIRRLRFATKGIAILPMKILSDTKWMAALELVCQTGRERMKEVCIHTHFSTENEMTSWTLLAMQELVNRGIKVRNQSVLIRGVNNSFDVMYRTVKKLAYLNIQPYYIYVHDMVPGCEHLRTTVAEACDLSKRLQGTIGGFNTPRVVCDAPGGGGKREVSSFENYDRSLGISSWSAPSVKGEEIFHYYDPIDQLPEAGREFWDNREGLDQRLAEIKAKMGSPAELV